MANKQVFPTKGNLIASKKSNSLAKMGYELMDRKRNILTREMMELVEDVRMLREQITDTYQRAYQALQEANMTQGVISDLAEAITGSASPITASWASRSPSCIMSRKTWYSVMEWN